MSKKPKIYTKTHTNPKAMKSHIAKIEARGGFWQIVKKTELQYAFRKGTGSKKIKARTELGLFKESAKNGYRRVKVKFLPFKPGMQGKIEMFVIPDEIENIVYLLTKSKDVDTIEWSN